MIKPYNHKSPFLHYTFALVFVGFVVVLLVSIFYKIEVVVSGNGRVVPLEKVQLVQSENLTRIKSIHATNGQFVEKGELLVELDTTQEFTNFQLLQLQERSLLAQKGRYEVFLNALNTQVSSTDASKDFASKFQKLGPIEQDQLILLQSELQDFKDEMVFLASRQQTVLASNQVTLSNQTETQKTLALASEKLAMTQSLFEKGVYSRSAFLEIETEIQAIEKTLNILSAEVLRGQAQAEEIAAEIAYSKTNKIQVLVSSINDLSLQLREIESKKIALMRAIATNRLHAPMSGHVANVANHTIGGIVEAGQTLLTIVPNQAVYIEAFFDNQNIGFLDVGQQANIKLAAFPAARFGFLKGEVLKISPDSIERSPDNWGYVVNIKPEKNHLMIQGQEYFIKAGMTAQIDVVTNHRPIIEYFLAPVWDVITNGLKEQ